MKTITNLFRKLTGKRDYSIIAKQKFEDNFEQLSPIARQCFLAPENAFQTVANHILKSFDEENFDYHEEYTFEIEDAKPDVFEHAERILEQKEDYRNDELDYETEIGLRSYMYKVVETIYECRNELATVYALLNAEAANAQLFLYTKDYFNVPEGLGFLAMGITQSELFIESTDSYGIGEDFSTNLN